MNFQKAAWKQGMWIYGSDFVSWEQMYDHLYAHAEAEITLWCILQKKKPFDK